MAMQRTREAFEVFSHRSTNIMEEDFSMLHEDKTYITLDEDLVYNGTKCYFNVKCDRKPARKGIMARVLANDSKLIIGIEIQMAEHSIGHGTPFATE